MKENCKIIEKDLSITNLNMIRRKYDIIDVNGTQITRSTQETDWRERYRPRKLFDLILPKKDYMYLSKAIKEGDIQHTLLYSKGGGKGKSSISQVLANELNMEFLCVAGNLNSDINTIRNNITSFSKTRTITKKKKLLLLEEFGDIPTKKMEMFKPILEMYASNVTAILTTNTKTNIPEPLMQRMTEINFNKVQDADQPAMLKSLILRIKAILDIEEVEYKNEDIQYLISTYKFSFREIIRDLQNAVTIDKKLDLVKMNENKTNFNDILNYINNKDFTGLAKIAESVNIIDFSETLATEYLNLLTSANDIPSIIISLNTLQNELNSNPMLESICFMNFCVQVIRSNITFKV